MSRRFCQVATIVAVVVNVSAAQPAVGAHGSGVTIGVRADSIARADTLTSESSRTQLIVLREQNKLIQEYQGKLLDTVYWALGGVIALAALLSGFSWWSNFRIYERDKKQMDKDLEARFKDFDIQNTLRQRTSQREAELKLNTMLDSHSNRHGAELVGIRAEMTSLRAEITAAIQQAVGPTTAAISSLDSRLEIQTSRFSQEVADLRKESTGLRAELQNSIDELLPATTNATHGIERTEKTIALTNAELRQVEEYVWELKNSFVAMLITQGQGLQAAVEAGNGFYVESVLQRMKATLEGKIIKQNITLDKTIVELMESRLRSAEKMKPHEVAEILELMRRVKLKDDGS